MLSQLVRMASDLLQGFLLASVVGGVSYVGLFLIRQPRLTFALASVAFLALLVGCYEYLVTQAFVCTLCAALLAPTIAAFAQKHLVSNSRGWLDGYFSLFLSTFFSIGGAYLVFAYAFLLRISISDTAGVTMFLLSLVAPSIIAFFLWMLKSIRFRPGMDTHLS